MSDQNQILRLLGTIREESAATRSRQEELFELLISYKDQIEDLKQTVLEKLAGLPKSPYIAGQLVPAPDKIDGTDDFRQLLATYLHGPQPTDEDDGGPLDVEMPPPRAVDPSEVQLESEGRSTSRGEGRSEGRSFLGGVGALTADAASPKLAEWMRVVRPGGGVVLVDRVARTQATRLALCAGLTELEQRAAARAVVTSGKVASLELTGRGG